MTKSKHLQPSTPDPFSWRKWRFEFLEASKGERWSSSISKASREDFFRKRHADGSSLWGYPSKMYDVRAAYERARRKHDPLLSPHGRFQALAHKNNLHAREFLEDFGPLHLRHGIHTVGQIEVNLSDFWSYHRRFRLVTQLWEARECRSALSKAWQEAFKHHKEVDDSGPLGFGDRQREWYAPPMTYHPYVWPWQLEKRDFESWERETPTSTMREHALQLVGSELDLHLSGSSISWERCWEPTKARFRQTILTKSLWASIWQLFGWDTCQIAWRRCPHCQKYFYPRRNDQFYCTSRQQGLASKRDYARRMRARQKEGPRRRK